MSEQQQQDTTPAPPASNGATDHANGEAAVVEGTVVEEEQPVIRMRNTPAMNGLQSSMNGHAAVQRGLEVLAEVETSQNVEEIKKLDSQLDHFNKYLEKYEKKNSELTERLSNLLSNQKEERAKRRESFLVREEEMKAEQETFDSQLRTMFAKCAQMRRTSAPVMENATVEHNNRRIREGANEAPIRETNGHEEVENENTGK